MNKEIQKYIGIGLSIIMVLAFIYVAFRWSRKGPDFTPAPLPDGGLDVRSMAMRLHSDMDGVNLTRDLDLYNEYLAMPNADFVAVYNDFGEMYYEQSGRTLRQWIEAENFALTSSVFTPWSIYAGSAVKDELINRFDSLNLQ